MHHLHHHCSHYYDWHYDPPRYHLSHQLFCSSAVHVAVCVLVSGDKLTPTLGTRCPPGTSHLYHAHTRTHTHGHTHPPVRYCGYCGVCVWDLFRSLRLCASVRACGSRLRATSSSSPHALLPWWFGPPSNYCLGISLPGRRCLVSHLRT